MGTRTWTFTNQSDHTQQIVVHDQKSADALRNALELLTHLEGTRWEVVQSAATSQSAPAPTTSPARTSAKTLPPAASAKPRASAPIAPPIAPPKEKAPEKRQFTRFNLQLRVILINGSHSFRTVSEDVSLGGMRLQNKIPAAFEGKSYFAYLSCDDLRENLELVCKVIGDSKDPCRIQFTAESVDQLKRLEEWIMQSTFKTKVA
jgi:hypothetical protein